MTRNKVAACLVGFAMIWLCSPAAIAQSESLALQARTGLPQETPAPKSPVQVEKTAVPLSGATWEVTLTVKGGGTQAFEQPVDIVLLLDCSPGMTSQIHNSAQDNGVRNALSKQAAQVFFAAAQTCTQENGFARSVPRTVAHPRKGALFAAAQRMDIPTDTAAQAARALGMAQSTLPAAHLTRIGVCKRGAEQFLEALAQQGVPARVGVVAYAGTSTVLLPLTALDGTAGQAPDSVASTSDSALPESRAVNAATAADAGSLHGGTAAVKNAVANLWQAAYTPDDLCYGSGRGANLERAFAAASTLLSDSRAAARYVVVVGGSQPGAYGVSEQSCLVPETDPAYAAEPKVTAATRAAAQALLDSGVTRVFTVGVGTNALSAYASSGAAYAAQSADATAPLCEIAALLRQRVQSPAVTDSAGDALWIEAASAVCTPAGVGLGAQPYVSVAPDGKSLYWSMGAWLQEGQTATLRYLLKAADSTHSTAGKEMPLGDATFLYSTPRSDGALQSVGVPFAAPIVRYATGMLRVYTSGLPAQLGGTSQVVGVTPVTDTACFQIQKPAEHAGWRIDSVIVNGETRTPAQFAEQTAYRLPVEEGTTVVEYRYVPAPTPAPQWSYTVQYYRDGLLLTDAVYLGSVPAAAPVVQSAPSRLDALPGCAENPVRTWPQMLTKDGQILRIDYLTQPREGAQLLVQHVYTNDSGAQIGAHTTAPAADAASYNVRDLFAPGYGGNVYMPTLATLTLTSADGTQAQQKTLPLASAFSCASGESATLEIRYVPLKPEQTVAQGTPGAGSAP